MNTFSMPPYKIVKDGRELAILVDRIDAETGRRQYIIYINFLPTESWQMGYNHKGFPTWWQPVQIGTD